MKSTRSQLKNRGMASPEEIAACASLPWDQLVDCLLYTSLRYQNCLFIKKLYRNSATAAGEAGNGALWCRRGMVPHGR